MGDAREALSVGPSRRSLIGGAMATGALAALAPLPVWAQQMQTHLPPGVTPKPKGPLVFRDYDKEELDYAYEQGHWLTNGEELGMRIRQKTAAALARFGPPREFSYGPTPIEKIYLYATQRENAPINVFLHGGTWRFGGGPDSYLQEMFIDAGAHFIKVDFTNVIDTNGNLMTLAEQVRRAVSWVFKNATSFGGNPNEIYVSGHSSGGHLAAVVLTTDWQNDFELPMDTVKGGLCSSGIYDLYPVSLSVRNTYVNFTDEVVEALSPQRHLDKLVAPVIVTHGSQETPEFQRQGREFAAAVREAGKPVTFLVGEGYNHFEIPQTLANPYGLLGRAVLQQMGLAPA